MEEGLGGAGCQPVVEEGRRGRMSEESRGQDFIQFWKKAGGRMTISCGRGLGAG